MKAQTPSKAARKAMILHTSRDPGGGVHSREGASTLHRLRSHTPQNPNELKYSTIRYLPKNKITIPNIETFYTITI